MRDASKLQIELLRGDSKNRAERILATIDKPGDFTLIPANVISGTGSAGYTVRTVQADGTQTTTEFTGVREYAGDVLLVFPNGPTAPPVIVPAWKGNLYKGRVAAVNGDGTYDANLRDWDDTTNVATYSSCNTWPTPAAALIVNQEVWLVFNPGSLLAPVVTV